MLISTAEPVAVTGRVHWGDDAPSLAVVLRDDVDLAVWRRPPRPELERAVDELLPALHGGARTTAPLDELPDAALELLARCGAPAGWAATLLARDAAALAARLGTLADARAVTLRLDLGGSCPLFHVDSVGLRLLCAYRGAGTEWVPTDAVRRDQLGLRGRSMDRANTAIVPNPHAIQRLAAGWVGIVKGSAWPGNAAHGQVHRSPATRDPRLLLIVDAEAA